MCSRLSFKVKLMLLHPRLSIISLYSFTAQHLHCLTTLLVDSLESLHMPLIRNCLRSPEIACACLTHCSWIGLVPHLARRAPFNVLPYVRLCTAIFDSLLHLCNRTQQAYCRAALSELIQTLKLQTTVHFLSPRVQGDQSIER